MNRRSFAESLAIAALAPVLGVPAEVLRLDPARVDAAPYLEFPDGPDAGESAALALALTEIIRRQYGSRLSDGELAAITHQIQAGLDRADMIRRAERDRGV